MKFDFTIDLSIEVKGLSLKIQDGKIRQIHPGEMAGKVTITLKDDVIAEKEFDSVALPGTITFSDGAEIRDDSEPRNRHRMDTDSKETDALQP